LVLIISQKEEKKVRDARQSAVKVGRRLSSRVVELFKPKKLESQTTAKVDENPPILDQPAVVAPLENPATTTSVDPTTTDAIQANTEVPPAAPVVAAAA
jgi:5,10-methylenetetrahydrofolate reductase